MNTVFLGLCNALSVVGLTSTTEDVGLQILYMFVSTLFFTLMNVGVKILTAVLEKKGLISKEDKKQIDHVAEDIGDDGKINNSNELDKSEK